MSAAGQLITSVNAALVDRVLGLNSGVRRLNLSKNAIIDVTPEISRLGGTLQSLDLSSNQLRVLGSAVSALPHLVSLYASSNIISDLSGLSQCTTLRKLDVADNRLRSFESLLPLQRLRNLQWLRLTGNPMASALPRDAYRDAVRRILPQLTVLDDEPLPPPSSSDELAFVSGGGGAGSLPGSAPLPSATVSLRTAAQQHALTLPPGVTATPARGAPSVTVSGGFISDPLAGLRARLRPASAAGPEARGQFAQSTAPSVASTPARPYSSTVVHGPVAAAAAAPAPALSAASGLERTPTAATQSHLDTTANSTHSPLDTTVTASALEQSDRDTHARYQAEISALTLRAASAEGERDGLASALDQLRARVESLSSQLASAHAELDSTRAQRDAESARAASAESQLQLAEDALRAREGQLSQESEAYAARLREAALAHDAELKVSRATWAAREAEWEDERGRWRAQLAQQAQGYESRLTDMREAVEHARRDVMGAASESEDTLRRYEEEYQRRIEAVEAQRRADAASAAETVSDLQLRISELHESLQRSDDEKAAMAAAFGEAVGDITRRMGALASVSSTAIDRLSSRLQLATAHISSGVLVHAADAQLLGLLRWAAESERAAWSDALTSQPRRARELHAVRLALLRAAEDAGVVARADAYSAARGLHVDSEGGDGAAGLSSLASAGSGEGDYDNEVTSAQDLIERVRAALDRAQAASSSASSSSGSSSESRSGALLLGESPALLTARLSSALSHLTALQHAQEAEITSAAHGLAAACAASDYLLSLVSSGASVADVERAAVEAATQDNSSALSPEASAAVNTALRELLAQATGGASQFDGSASSRSNGSSPWPAALLDAARSAVSLLDSDSARSELASAIVERRALSRALEALLAASHASEEATIAQLQSSVVSLQYELEGARASHARLAGANQALRARLTEAIAAADGARAQAEAAVAGQLASVRDDAGRTAVRASALQTELDACRREVERARAEVSRLEGELTAQAKRHSELHARLVDEAAAAQARLTEQQSRLTEHAAATHSMLLEQLGASQSQLARLGESHESLRRERDSLLQLAVDFGIVTPPQGAPTQPAPAPSTGAGFGLYPQQTAAPALPLSLRTPASLVHPSQGGPAPHVPLTSYSMSPAAAGVLSARAALGAVSGGASGTATPLHQPRTAVYPPSTTTSPAAATGASQQPSSGQATDNAPAPQLHAHPAGIPLPGIAFMSSYSGASTTRGLRPLPLPLSFSDPRPVAPQA